MMGRIHQEGQGHLEHIRHFARMRRDAEPVPQDRHYRRDAVRRAGEIGVEISDRLDKLPRDPRLFFSLAQGGVDRAVVLHVNAPARKRHLARVA